MCRLPAIIAALLAPACAYAAEEAAEGSGVDFLTPLVPQIIWSVATFALALFVLGKFAWPAIMKALDERERRIRDALASAEKAQKEAEEAREQMKAALVEENRRMDGEIAAMKADLARRREELIAAARQEADAVRRKAVEAIDQAKLQAIAEVRLRAVDLAIASAERIIARRLTTEDDRRLAQEVVDSFTPPTAG